MNRTDVSFDDLTRILREGAGTDEEVVLGSAAMDTDFEVLGYDSLALLETAARIGREFGITVDDDVIATSHTPRQLLDAVNSS